MSRHLSAAWLIAALWMACETATVAAAASEAHCVEAVTFYKSYCGDDETWLDRMRRQSDLLCRSLGEFVVAQCEGAAPESLLEEYKGIKRDFETFPPPNEFGTDRTLILSSRKACYEALTDIPTCVSPLVDAVHGRPDPAPLDPSVLCLPGVCSTEGRWSRMAEFSCGETRLMQKGLPSFGGKNMSEQYLAKLDEVCSGFDATAVSAETNCTSALAHYRGTCPGGERELEEHIRKCGLFCTTLGKAVSTHCEGTSFETHPEVMAIREDANSWYENCYKPDGKDGCFDMLHEDLACYEALYDVVYNRTDSRPAVPEYMCRPGVCDEYLSKVNDFCGVYTNFTLNHLDAYTDALNEICVGYVASSAAGAGRDVSITTTLLVTIAAAALAAWSSPSGKGSKP